MNANRYSAAIDKFKENNNILRMSEAIRQGIPQHILYAMLSEGILVREERGLYRLVDNVQFSNPDFINVSLLVPKAIICLTSALYFYNLTTQIPHLVYIALPGNFRIPKLIYPPIEVIRLSPGTYSAGINDIVLDGVGVRIYSPEKTIADCFKFRNRIGEDIPVEALKDYMKHYRPQIEKLMVFARLDRVEKLMKPYLQSLV